MREELCFSNMKLRVRVASSTAIHPCTSLQLTLRETKEETQGNAGERYSQFLSTGKGDVKPPENDRTPVYSMVIGG